MTHPDDTAARDAFAAFMTGATTEATDSTPVEPTPTAPVMAPNSAQGSSGYPPALDAKAAAHAAFTAALDYGLGRGA